MLGITVRDRSTLRLRFICADDDPNYDLRNAVKREKNAARNRRYRAARATGRKPGRPKSEDVPAWQVAGFKSERTYYRNKARDTETETGSKNASRDIINNRHRHAISLPSASLKPWQLYGLTKPTYYRRKAAGTLPAMPSPEPLPMLPAIDLAAFGITAIQIRRGSVVVAAWAGERLKRPLWQIETE